MSLPISTRAWILKKKPEGKLDLDSTFALETRPLPELSDGQILRTWIFHDLVPDRCYVPFPEEGNPMPTIFLGEVVASKSAHFSTGSLVTGFGAWSEYIVLPEEAVQPAYYPKGYPSSLSLSALGLTSMTAWVGLHKIGQIKPEHSIVISGAAGATGSAAVQIAKKLVGCKRVVGIAGGKEKCDWVKKLGADECLDYRSSTFAEDLAEATEVTATDNVGGSILNLMFKRMARFSRIVACGSIASYDGEPMYLNNFVEITTMRLTVQGFIVTDHIADYPHIADELTKAIEDGRFSVEGCEHKVEAPFEDVPKTWMLLFSGANKGKLLTQLK
ncbi:hypothetical protein JCM8097_003313 [Rhodosporidiobolus ruineniae]